MSSLWSSLKDKTRMGVQFLKEKTGITQTKIDPRYQSSSERFAILQDRVSQFFHDFEVLISLLPKVTSSGVDFSTSLIQSTMKYEDQDMTLPRAFEQFFMATDELVKNDVLPLCADAVPAEVLLWKERFEFLERLKSERKQMQLLCDATRDRLDSLTKKGTPQEIAELRIEYQGKLRELEEKTDKFVTEVDNFWELRFTVIELPMERFIGLIMSMCRKIFDNMKELQRAIDPELLEKDFAPAH